MLSPFVWDDNNKNMDEQTFFISRKKNLCDLHRDAMKYILGFLFLPCDDAEKALTYMINFSTVLCNYGY